MKTQSRSGDLQGTADLIKSYGQDPDVIANRVGLDPNALYKTGISVDSLSFVNFLEEAARSCKDRFFSLKVAQIQGWDILGPIWLLIRRADTVYEALNVITDHLEFHSNSASAHLLTEEDRLVLCYEIRTQALGTELQEQSEIQAIELGLAMSSYELRRILGNDWRPLYAQFRHSPPYNLEPLKKVFGERISFNQDRNAIHLSKEDGQQPLASSRPAYRKILQREIQSQLGDSIPFSIKTDRIIRLLIDEHGCSIEKVAENLGVSARTLQLRLKQEEKSYQKIYDQARLEIAVQYIESSTLSIAAIAERLNFTETAAFSRFFKRHMGISPRELLKQRRNSSHH
jgi:AraC-like DNA-binding protein